MSTAADFLNSILDRAGVSKDDPDRVAVLAASDLTKINVPPTLVDKVNPKLLSVEDALQHPEIRKAISGTTIGGLQEELKQVAKEIGIEGDDYNAVFGGNNHRYTDRVKALVDKIAAKERQRAGADTPEDKAKYTKQIEDLRAQLTNAGSEWKQKHDLAVAELQSVKQQIEAERLQNQLMAVLPLDKVSDAIPAEYRASLVLQSLNAELAAKGAKIVSTPAGLKLVQADSPELEYFDTTKNAKVSLSDFVNGVLKAKNLLKADAPAPAPAVIIGQHGSDKAKTTSQAQQIHQGAVNEALTSLRAGLGKR